MILIHGSKLALSEGCDIPMLRKFTILRETGAHRY